MFAKAKRHNTRESRHFVDNGNVWCPLKKSDIDIENCFRCSALNRVGEIENMMYVQCQSVSPDQFENGTIIRVI